MEYGLKLPLTHELLAEWSQYYNWERHFSYQYTSQSPVPLTMKPQEEPYNHGTLHSFV